MKKLKTGLLLTLLLFLFPSVNAQVVFETAIKVNNEIIVEHSIIGSHTIKVNKGDSVRIVHTLTNYFDSDFVDFEVTYSVVYGEDLISEISTSGLKGYWSRKGTWTNFEFYFVAEESGKVWITFRYEGTYWEEFPTSQPKTFSSLASFSSLRFEIVEESLATPILLAIVGVAVIVVSSLALLYRRRKP